jgi:glutaredoxin-like protein NrdH
VVDLSENPDALEYVQDLGYLQAPVVVVDDDDHWAGFRPDHIERVAAHFNA